MKRKGSTTKQSTSWGHVASWYADSLGTPNSFQREVILPNLLRILDLGKHPKLLDLACGPGYFACQFAELGAFVTGVDISPELIAIATKNGQSLPTESRVRFFSTAADRVPQVTDHSVDIVTIILALENIENVEGVIKECARVLSPAGRLVIVMNHPAFRAPKSSSWGWDETGNVQYRRLDSYLSERRVYIDIHPGQKRSDTVVTFHRSMQYYFKVFAKYGFGVKRLEEWISHRHDSKGPRHEAIEKARKEFPLFLCLELGRGAQ